MHEIKEKGVVNLPTGLCCFMEMHKHEGPNSHFLAATVMGLGGTNPIGGFLPGQDQCWNPTA